MTIMQRTDLIDRVPVKNFSGSSMWVRGEVVEVTGPVSYKVRLNSDSTVHR